MTKKEIKKLLTGINRFRKATGLAPVEDLPKGRKGSTTTCPVANALNHGRRISVGRGSVYFTSRALAEEFARATGGYVKELGTHRNYDQKTRDYKDVKRKHPYEVTWQTHNISDPGPVWFRLLNKFVGTFDDGQLPRYDVTRRESKEHA